MHSRKHPTRKADLHSSVGLPSFRPRVLQVHEPTGSTTSLHHVQEQQEDEELKESMHRTAVPEDKLSRDVLAFELNTAVHMLLIGDVSATICQLNLMLDMNLKDEFIQKVLYHNFGVSVIINLLEVENVQCNIGALKVIEKMASNNKMRIIFANLGVIPLLVFHLTKAAVDMKILLAKALSTLCIVHRCARYFRKEGGIPLLIDCLDVEESTIYTNTKLLSDQQKDNLVLATAAASTLKQLAKYPKSIGIMYESGLVPCIRNIANSCHKVLLVEAFGLLAYCATFNKIRHDIERGGTLLPLLQCVIDDDAELRTACATTLAHCAADSELTCHIVRMLEGLKNIADLTKNRKQDTKTLAAVISAAAKLAQDNRNLKIMSDRGVVYNLIKCFSTGLPEEELLSNVLEGLAECARLEDNRIAISSAGIIPIAVGKLMGGDEPRLLTATAMFLGTCARSEDIAEMIVNYNGMRLLFSLLLIDDPGTQATGLWALRPLISNTTESAEEVRCVVGGFNLLLKQVSSRDPDVTSRACNLLAEICKDRENLQILSDWGLVRLLTSRANDPNAEVRFSVAEAIAYASSLHTNAREFGRRGVIPVVRSYLATSNVMLHMYAMEALSKLTEIPFNCVILHECDVVTPILHDLASPYDELQRLATLVLRNMRHVALRAEKNAVEGCRLSYFGNLGRTTRKIVPTKNEEKKDPEQKTSKKAPTNKEEKGDRGQKSRKIPTKNNEKRDLGQKSSKKVPTKNEGKSTRVKVS